MRYIGEGEQYWSGAVIWGTCVRFLALISLGEMKVLVRFMLLGGFNERDTYCILGEVHNIG